LHEIHQWDVNSCSVARVRWSENSACQGIMVIEAQRCGHFGH